MEQLIMRWENDNTPAKPLHFPEGFELTIMPMLDDGVEKWLDIMQYGLSEKREGFSYYQETMLDLPNYEEDKCFFILHKGKAVATITIVCDLEKKEGLVHMVGSLPECRGRGVGNMLGEIAVSVLKRTNMRSAFLRTDDFRVPAIKVYLKAGFRPDVSTQDYVCRWNALYQQIGAKE